MHKSQHKPSEVILDPWPNVELKDDDGPSYVSELRLDPALSNGHSGLQKEHGSQPFSKEITRNFSHPGLFRGDGYIPQASGIVPREFTKVVQHEKMYSYGQSAVTIKHHKAAITIQAAFRGYRTRKVILQEKEHFKKLRESVGESVLRESAGESVLRESVGESVLRESEVPREHSLFRSIADSPTSAEGGGYISTLPNTDPHLELLMPFKTIDDMEQDNMIRAGRNYMDRNTEASNKLLDPNYHVILLLGGINPRIPQESHLLGSCVYVYVVEKNKWFFGGTLPEPRCYHAATLIDGKVYVTGGLSPCKIQQGEPVATRTLFQLDVKSNRWNTRAPMIHCRAYHGICSLNKQIVVFGGKDDTGRILSTVEAYDIERNQWIIMKSLPKAVMGMSVAVLDDTIYLIGGLTFEAGDYKLSSEVYMYHIKNPGWFMKCRLQEPLAFCSAATIRREIWLFGGLTEQLSSDGHMTSSDTVYTLTGMDHPRCVNFGEKLSLKKHSMAVTKILGQKIFLMGGMSSQSREAVKENDIFDREVLRMYNGHSLPQAMTGSSAISLLPDTSERLLHKWGDTVIPDEVQEIAATKIQAVFRGHQIRNAMNKMKNRSMYRSNIGALSNNQAFEHKRQSRQGMKFAAAADLDDEFSMYKTVLIREWPPTVDASPSTSKTNLTHGTGYVTIDTGHKDQGKRYWTLSLDCDPNLGAVPKLDDAIRKTRKVLGLKRWEPNPYRDLQLSNSNCIKHDWLPIVLILGGLKVKEPSNYAYGRSVLEYNPVKNLYKFAGKMPQPRNHHAACYMDGFVYVSGGYDPHLLNSCEMVATDTLFALNIALGEWTQKKSMQSSRAFHALVPNQGKLYAVGGRNKFGRLVASIECFNTATNEWILLRPLPSPKMGMAAVFFEKQIWCMGGIGSEGDSAELNVLTSVSSYDLIQNAWINRPPLRCPRAFGTCVNVNKMMWLCAGCCRMKDQRNLISMASVDRFNVSEGAWERCTILSNPRHCSAITAVEECIYFIGGITSQEWGAQPHTEMMITREHSIYDCKDPPHAITGAAAVTIPPRSPSLRCESLSNLLDYNLRKV